MAVSLKSKTARAKLEPRRDPYWVRLSHGVHIGFRKLAGAGGTWIGRTWGTSGSYQFTSLGSETGKEYDEACREVAKWADELSRGIQNDRKMTVGDVCRAYVSNRRIEKGEKTAYDCEKRFERYVYQETCELARGEKMPNGQRKRVDAFVYDMPIGDITFSMLQPRDVERWRDAQLDDDDPEDEESYNRAKDSVNRNMKTLKAAFNYGKDKLKLVSSDNGWKSIDMFKKKGGGLIGARRDGYLNKEQRTQILAVMPADLRTLSIALLLIGARPGELAAANVNDFDRASGKLVLSGKTGERTVTLSSKAVEFFTTQTKDRIGNAPLLVMENGERWTAPVWGRTFRQARDLADMPNAVLYCMRHTFITEAIAQGLNIYQVAKQTGTSVEIIQSNYGNDPEDLVERLDKIAIV